MRHGFVHFPPETVFLRWLAIVARRSLSPSVRAAMAFLMLVNLAQGHGAYHDVVEEITQKLAVTPEDAALHFKLACAHQEHGEWKAALIECERVRRLDATGFDTDYIEGKALAAGGHLEAAKGILDAFLAQHPQHASALAERGRVHLKLKKQVEAQNDFAAALSLEKHAPVDWWLEAAQAGKAVEVLRKALLAHADDPQLLNASLEAELKAGNTDEALRRVDAMQKIAPRAEPWMASRAQVLAAAGRGEEARAAWTALRAHLLSLPNLERGTPLLAGVLAETEKALGIAAPAVVVAPPAPAPPP
jgi:tetratricopeptide (TPR) repeat protein